MTLLVADVAATVAELLNVAAPVDVTVILLAVFVPNISVTSVVLALHVMLPPPDVGVDGSIRFVAPGSRTIPMRLPDASHSNGRAYLAALVVARYKLSEGVRRTCTVPAPDVLPSASVPVAAVNVLVPAVHVAAAAPLAVTLTVPVIVTEYVAPEITVID